MEAAEVVSKNENVYTDLSGFIAGRDSYHYVLEHQQSRIREAVDWIGDASRILYGSDWPLTPMKEYSDFIKAIFPSLNDQKKVFYSNAVRFFDLEVD